MPVLLLPLAVPPGLWFAGCFLFIMGSVACFLPFTRHFLHTSHTMPRMDQWLRVLGILFAASLVFFILAPFFPRIYILTPFWAGCTLVAYASVLLAGALALRKRLPYARLYLVGDASAFTATGTMAALAQTTLIHRFGTTLLILPWIVIVHVLVLSLSLVLMTRLASRKLAQERERNLEQSRFTIIGQSMAKSDMRAGCIMYYYPFEMEETVTMNDLEVLDKGPVYWQVKSVIY